MTERDVLGEVVEELCREESYRLVVHFDRNFTPMPSTEALSEIMDLLRAVIFPGYFLDSDVTKKNITYHTGAKLDRAFTMLVEEIKKGLCYSCAFEEEKECSECGRQARDIALAFIERIPEIRRMLSLDVVAAFEGDPAAKSHGETIFCYPSIRMMTCFRIAHELNTLQVPLIPRMITEMGHSETGIDIHPQATIGEKFFMDHGTGIVIGGTCIIGNNVKVYQNVTLGALSFPLDEDGNPIKGIPRHPIVEDNVVIYSGATVLGRITIGKNSMIGGNVWLTRSVPEGSKVLRGREGDV